MQVAVFCSFKDLDRKYIDPAERFIELLAKAGHHVVFGGSNVGLMKVVADTAQKHGAHVTAVSFEKLRASVRQSSDEIVVMKDLPERKRELFARSDAFVVLPGGLGTLDEITEMMELRKHKLHAKPIVVFNINGFFGGFKSQLERMEREGFLPEPLSAYVAFTDTPEETLAALGGAAVG